MASGCSQPKRKELIGKSKSALRLSLVSSFSLTPFLLHFFNLLSVGQGVDILNPKTFAGREHNSRKEQKSKNSWYVINRVAEQAQGTFQTKTVSLSVDDGIPHCGRSTFFIKSVIHCNENGQIFFLIKSSST